jgi:hypothetical protein
MNGSAEQHASIPVRAAGVWSWWQEGINVEVNKLFFVTRFFVKHLEKQNIDLAPPKINILFFEAVSRRTL